MTHVPAFAALAVAGLTLLSGCSASVRYHSKAGRTYGELTRVAVHCEENEAQTVAAAGAEVIGSISSKALGNNVEHGDLTERAQTVAARKGGTHIVLTEKGEDFFTVVNRPAQVTTDCTRTPDALECRSTTTPATSTTYARARASFVVLRLAPERWASLPPQLRPVRYTP